MALFTCQLLLQPLLSKSVKHGYNFFSLMLNNRRLLIFTQKQHHCRAELKGNTAIFNSHFHTALFTKPVDGPLSCPQLYHLCSKPPTFCHWSFVTCTNGDAFIPTWTLLKASTMIIPLFRIHIHSSRIKVDRRPFHTLLHGYQYIKTDGPLLFQINCCRLLAGSLTWGDQESSRQQHCVSNSRYGSLIWQERPTV